MTHSHRGVGENCLRAGKVWRSSSVDMDVGHWMRGVMIKWKSGEGIAWGIKGRLSRGPIGLSFGSMGLV